MADKIRELIVNPVKDPGTCEVCGKNQTQMQCVSCKQPHYLCVECHDIHRKALFGQ
jgi:hypothetical protein